MQTTAAGTSEDWRAASNIAVTLSQYLITVSLAVMAGQAALAPTLIGKSKRSWPYYISSIIAVILLVVSILYGGWAIAYTYKEGFEGRWKNNSAASREFNSQAICLLIGFVVALGSVALALLPEKVTGEKGGSKTSPSGKEVSTYFIIVGVVFLAIALVHALRLFSAWTVVVGSVCISKWVSWIALIVSLLLGAWGLRLKRRSS